MPASLASGGYIITISPIAIVTDVVSIEMLDNHFEKPGKKYPSPIPTPIAIKIHKVKNLSKKDNLLFENLTPSP